MPCSQLCTACEHDQYACHLNSGYNPERRAYSTYKHHDTLPLTMRTAARELTPRREYQLTSPPLGDTSPSLPTRGHQYTSLGLTHISIAAWYYGCQPTRHYKGIIRYQISRIISLAYRPRRVTPSDSPPATTVDNYNCRQLLL